MEQNMMLMEKVVIVPEKPTRRERIFLSNIDLGLVAYQDFVCFFDPPTNGMSFEEACNRLYASLGHILVPYAFMAGRLVPSSDGRLEIDCNDAGVVVAAAKMESRFDQLGELVAPKPHSKDFIAFLYQDGEENLELCDKPLIFLQLTQMGCGSLALGSRFNHCVFDGIGVYEFERNLAALTRGDSLVTIPNTDRGVFKARNPPKILYQHLEYSPSNSETQLGEHAFTTRGLMSSASYHARNNIHLIYLSPIWIANARKAALQDGVLKKCSAFQVVAAKIWKARSIAVGMKPEEKNSTMLFPVDCRKRVVPEAPPGFTGNGLVPGYARATISELMGKQDSYIVRKVQEGVERLTDEYIKSGIDWLEVNKGTPCTEDSFSLVAWWRLGLEEEEFGWGKLKYATLITLKPGLVILLPGPRDEGGLNVCLELPDDQATIFRNLMVES